MDRYDLFIVRNPPGVIMSAEMIKYEYGPYLLAEEVRNALDAMDILVKNAQHDRDIWKEKYLKLKKNKNFGDVT